jgi:outer membrane receptor protein involved in Fe transport
LTLQEKYGFPDLQLSYSKRINRPNQWQLNPFVVYSDPYNVFKGNPDLRPELTDAIELSAYYNTKPVVITGSVYFRQTNSPITRYMTVDSASVSTTTSYNLDFNRSTGAELVTRFTLLKKLKVILNGNLYKYVLSGNVQGNEFIGDRVMYSGKANLNYTFWKKTEIQASYSYMGPFLTPQGKTRSHYGLDAGIKKDLLNDKLSFSINMSDIFNNRRFNTLMDGEGFTGNFYRKRESRIITFNILWKFGNAGQADKKPKLPEILNHEY